MITVAVVTETNVTNKIIHYPGTDYPDKYHPDKGSSSSLGKGPPQKINIESLQKS